MKPFCRTQGSQTIWGTLGHCQLGTGMWLTLSNMLFPMCVTMSVPYSVTPLERNYGDLPEILTAHASPFGSHKVTGTHTDRSDTYDFQLMIHSNLSSPISYRFLDKQRFLYLKKIAFFPHPRVFNAPAWGVSLEFCNGVSAPKKTSHAATTWLERVWRYVHSFWYNTRVWQTDRLIDRRTE